MWGLYTLLLLLNSSCGGTRYTRRNRHNKDHHTESHSPRTMSTSEGRASKKAKIVDNEPPDGDSTDGVQPVDSRSAVRRTTWSRTHPAQSYME